MKNILIYGYCGMGKDVFYSVDKKEYAIVGIIDDAPKLVGQKCRWGTDELDIFDCTKICNYEFDYIVISNTMYFGNMMQRLQQQHVEPSKILLWKINDGLSKLDYRMVQLQMCVDRIKENNVMGSCAEVGVYRGEFASYINSFLPDRRLYLFDTFEGFGNQKVLDEEAERNSDALKKQFMDTSEAVVLQNMSNPEQCIIRKGYFPDTVVGLDDRFALVSLDADLYQPIKDGLEYFYPRLAQGGYIFIHDYGTWECGKDNWTGVKQAVDEFIEKTGAVCFPIMDRCLSVVIGK